MSAWEIVNNNSGRSTIREDGDIIAMVYGSEERSVTDNARLVAAAPELLAACRYAAGFAGLQLTAEQSEIIGKRLRAAINQATGGKP